MFKKLITVKCVAICMVFLSIMACSSDYISKVSKERKIKKEVYFNNMNLEGLNVREITDILNEYSSDINIEPKDAYLDKDKWSVEPERNGKKLNIDKTIDLILRCPKGEKVNPIVEDVKPNITKDIVEENIVEIGSFTTQILDDRESRVTNLEIAADYIDNTKIMPNKEFSFNETVGKRNKEKGYKKAPIIIKTKNGSKKGYGVGGGICQISTTLYNAALSADLKIIEQHPHSKNVGYVEKGKDATVVFGGADLKFQNSRSYPIMIKVCVFDEKVTVKVYEIRDTQLL